MDQGIVLANIHSFSVFDFIHYDMKTMRYFTTRVSPARAVAEGKIHSSKRADKVFLLLH